MDPAREISAPALRCVLGHVDDCAAVLAAECQALQQAECDQDRRREPADGIGLFEPCVGGEQADHEGREAHDEDRQEERVLPADQVAETAEEHGTERPDEEARREGQKGEHVAGRLRERGEELRPDHGGQRAIEIEIVPLENRSGGRCQDHFLLFPGHGAISCDRLPAHCDVSRHLLPPRCVQGPVRNAGIRLRTSTKDLLHTQTETNHHKMVLDETGGANALVAGGEGQAGSRFKGLGGVRRGGCAGLLQCVRDTHTLLRTSAFAEEDRHAFAPAAHAARGFRTSEGQGGDRPHMDQSGGAEGHQVRPGMAGRVQGPRALRRGARDIRGTEQCVRSGERGPRGGREEDGRVGSRAACPRSPQTRACARQPSAPAH